MALVVIPLFIGGFYMSTTRGRAIAPNQIVYDQADFFGPDGFLRQEGLTIADIALQVTLNNQVIGWPLVDGSTVPDGQVVSGKVYWSAIPNGPYSVRWRPNTVGFWRLLLTYAAGYQIVGQAFDVGGSSASTVPPHEDGMRTSFVRPSGSGHDC